ncbi:MAG: aldehyde dehydrogenase family protein [Pseudomonadales bacterium]|nr:aldehyde dehydrogenase family protein [Pseudomonadales bacterium]
MSQNVVEILASFGASPNLNKGDIALASPVDGGPLGHLQSHTSEEVDEMIAKAQQAFLAWRKVPAPKRGQLVRILGEKLRKHKDALGRLVTIECGKIYQEGLGEVQEMIDICDFAVGLSRQLYGLTIASERPGHKMVENWHPIGPVGVISAFNFPVAVWAWNTALALVCGDSVIWKPSEKTPLTALACQAILQEALDEFNEAPANLSQVLIGDAKAGEQMVSDSRMSVISATGSCTMGRKVAPVVAARFGRTILELGGNNAIIVCPSADLTIALTGIVFGAVGTAGQRCTSTRRLFLHEDIYDKVVSSIKEAYASVSIGDPLDEKTLVGPLIDEAAFANMEKALLLASEQGALIAGGERVNVDEYKNAFYVQPAVVEMPANIKSVKEETFAPILYIFKYTNLEDAIMANNDVPQGLSSAIFTNSVREAELFTSAVGSDCGIANVNIGTSGAEIGGAFGGEKETGGGRESGSDAWKGYMRRSTSTVNYSTELPLAQGIKFDLG